MDKRTQYLADRALDGALTASENREWQTLVLVRPELHVQLQADRQLKTILQGTGSLAPGFEHRVMSRLYEQPAEGLLGSLSQDLVALFYRASLPAAAISFVLIGHNLVSLGVTDSWIEAVFGLTALSPETALFL